MKIQSESPEKKLQKTCEFFEKNLHTFSPSSTKNDAKSNKEDNNKNSDVEIEASDNDKTSKKISLNQYDHSSDITKCKIIDNVSISDVDAQKIILDLFLVEMPKDFFQFYEFYKNVSKNNSLSIYKSTGLKLVGPYDILEGKIKYSESDQNRFLTHWRYYYDPPEFQVCKKDETSTNSIVFVNIPNIDIQI